MLHALWVAITLTVLHLWGRETEVLLDFAASLSVIVMASVLVFLFVQRGLSIRDNSVNIYQQMIESMGMGILQVDTDERVVYANPVFCAMTGYSLHELRGQVASSILLDTHEQPVMQKRGKERARGRSESYELPVRTKEGLLKYFRVYGTPLYNASGKFIGSLGVHYDITDKKEALASLKHSEQCYRNLAESTKALFFNSDLRGLFTFVNEAGARTLGYRVDELLGRFYLQFVYPEDRERVHRIFWDQLRSAKHNVTVDVRFLGKKDGWVRLIVNPIIEDGVMTGLAGIGIDITEQKRVEQQREDAINQLTTLYSNLPVAVFALDMVRNRMLVASPAHLDVFGYPPEAFFENPNLWYQLALPEDRPRIDAGYPILNAGQKLLGQFRINHPSGEVRWIEARIQPTMDSQGRLVRLDGIASDITAVKRAQEQLQKAKEAAEASSKLKDSFIAMISHEIRTPLNVIFGFLELLSPEYSTTLSDEEWSEYYSNIKENGTRLMRTIDEILNLSTLRAGTYASMHTTFDLYDEVRQLVKSFECKAAEKQIALQLLDEPRLIPVHLDKYSVGQAISNLLDNALKYTLEGSVTVRFIADADTQFVEIRDTGIGIAPEFLPFLFDEFTQEGAGYSRPYDGVGLGLSLVKMYVEVNDGTIDVQTSKGVGTTFTLGFPLNHRNGASSAVPL